MLNDSFKYTAGDAPVVPPTPVKQPKAKREHAEHKRASVPWGPLAAIVYSVVVYFLAQFTASMLVILYPHLHGWNRTTADYWLDHSIVAQFLFVLFAEVLTFGAIWFFIRMRKGTLQSVGLRWPRLKDPVYTLGGFLVYFLAYAMLFTLATHIFPSLNVDQKQELGFDNVAGQTNLILTFFSLVVMPPIVEEFVFRGFMFTGLRTKLNPIWAGLITSVVFASAHLQAGSGQPLLWTAAIDTFTLSVVLCFLRHKTNSLWPGIFLHALKNCIAFISLYIIVQH